MKKIILVLARKDYRDEEYELARKELEKSGIEVRVASTDASGPAEGSRGGFAKVDFLLRDVVSDDFDAIAFIGGPGSKSYVGHAVASDLARTFLSSGKIVGAICFAPAILAEAGVLSGRRATGWKTDENDEVPQMIIKGGGEYVDEPVVFDKGVVTAAGPEAASDFGKRIATEMA
jgi:protease I